MMLSISPERVVSLSIRHHAHEERCNERGDEAEELLILF